MKTGSQGRSWVNLPPKPQPVHDVYAYWQEPPPERSDRCSYWVEQFKRGWQPNRRVHMMGYDPRAHWFGVYMWEYLNILWPIIRNDHE